MTWKPTEGQRRADALMREMLESAQCLGIPVATTEFPMHHARVFTLISAAIDQAITDGAAQEALALAALDGAIGNGHDPLPAGWHRDDQGLIHAGAMPAIADPVGFEATFPGTLLPPAAASVTEHDDGTIDITLAPLSAPKKRGRPKGSKGKAKKAKATKAAKVKAEEPVDLGAGIDALLANGSAEPAPAEAPPA